MIDSKRICADVSVCDQISTDDLPLIEALGFKTIICNRPDGEKNDQQLFEVIKKVAQRAGVDAIYVPIQTSEPQPDELSKLEEAIATCQTPILAYCKSGARSETAFKTLSAKEPKA